MGIKKKGYDNLAKANELKEWLSLDGEITFEIYRQSPILFMA